MLTASVESEGGQHEWSERLETCLFKTGWWFQIFFIFTPKIGEIIPNLTNIFQMGWNHHLENLRLANVPKVPVFWDGDTYDTWDPTWGSSVGFELSGTNQHLFQFGGLSKICSSIFLERFPFDEQISFKWVALNHCFAFVLFVCIVFFVIWESVWRVVVFNKAGSFCWFLEEAERNKAKFAKGNQVLRFWRRVRISRFLATQVGWPMFDSDVEA